MTKNNKKTIIIVLIALAILLFVFVLPNITQEEQPGISVLLFDTEGNEITPRHPFAIVGGTPSVDSIRLKVTLQNTGPAPDGEIITCNLIGTGASISTEGSGMLPGSTNYFDDYMVDDTERIILPQAFASWTTNNIPVQSEISAGHINGDITFSVTAYCFDIFGDLAIQPEDSLLINIVSDGTPLGTASVTVTQVAGTEELYCGDGCCNDGVSTGGTCVAPYSDIGEDSSNCPIDCAPTFQQVEFRTSDLSYGAESEIAWTSSCGTTLSRYGRTIKTGTLSGTCSAASKSWCGTNPIEIQGVNVPGEWLSGGDSISIWDVTESGILCLCDDDGGYHSFRKYDSSRDNDDNVETQSDSLEGGQQITEANC